MSKTKKVIAEAYAILEGRKHWNDECGWDVPAIEARRAVDLLASALEEVGVAK